MINAKQEFLSHVRSVNDSVLCCIVKVYNRSELVLSTVLTTGYTVEEYDQFLNLLDTDYDNGYGTQKLFGTIWFKNGFWSSRYEYDGSEHWDYNECPEIPIELVRPDKVREEKINGILDI